MQSVADGAIIRQQSIKTAHETKPWHNYLFFNYLFSPLGCVILTDSTECTAYQFADLDWVLHPQWNKTCMGEGDVAWLWILFFVCFTVYYMTLRLPLWSNLIHPVVHLFISVNCKEDLTFWTWGFKSHVCLEPGVDFPTELTSAGQPCGAD